MNGNKKLKPGDIYFSKRTGKKITITAIEGNIVYYEVEDFKTIAPLFLTLEKFRHLVGLDDSRH
ncbi:hypothetical protein LXM94_17125 [Rhizobium sp. TRM95111]|uniref:hypothetical protein n=1 Tax=Rhizobium alarense TaxID=2846851 RepID=UPI001F214138|nr:hypothetical protein [Rhizobium alarense]MCF3641697.1 hypothetical protein [Rhizobium alarense]